MRVLRVPPVRASDAYDLDCGQATSGCADALLCAAAGLQSLEKYEQFRPQPGRDAMFLARNLFHDKEHCEGLRAV